MKLRPKLDLVAVEGWPADVKTFNLAEGNCYDPKDPASSTLWNNLNEHGDEFVTNPRCSVVVLKASKDESSDEYWTYGYTFDHCSVYIPTGVKIKDLLYVVHALEEQMRDRHAIRLKLVGQVAVESDKSHIGMSYADLLRARQDEEEDLRQARLDKEKARQKKQERAADVWWAKSHQRSMPLRGRKGLSPDPRSDYKYWWVWSAAAVLAGSLAWYLLWDAEVSKDFA